MFLATRKSFGGFHPCVPFARLQQSRNCYIVAVCVYLTLQTCKDNSEDQNSEKTVKKTQKKEKNKRLKKAEKKKINAQLAIESTTEPQKVFDSANCYRNYVINDRKSFEKRVFHDRGNSTKDLVRKITGQLSDDDWSTVTFNDAHASEIKQNEERMWIRGEAGSYGVVYNFIVPSAWYDFHKEMYKKHGHKPLGYGYTLLDGDTIETKPIFIPMDKDNTCKAEQTMFTDMFKHQREQIDKKEKLKHRQDFERLVDRMINEIDETSKNTTSTSTATTSTSSSTPMQIIILRTMKKKKDEETEKKVEETEKKDEETEKKTEKNRIVLHVNPSDTVGFIKLKIQEETEVETKNQRLVFNEEELLDVPERTLECYDIKGGSTIKLLEKSDEDSHQTFHSMVILGAIKKNSHSLISRGKEKTYFMLLNWWEHMPLVVVTARYLQACHCKVAYSAKKLDKNAIEKKLVKTEALFAETCLADSGSFPEDEDEGVYATCEPDDEDVWVM